ncbi:MAG: hypothetical protein HYU64_11160 [Armatimonadetes bacterium]|nr:hypothetical protein [Armatimonadota bacterium]
MEILQKGKYHGKAKRFKMVSSSSGAHEDSSTADVLLDLGSSRIDRPFTYFVPEEIRGGITVGSQVLVPFRARLHAGYVIGCGASADSDPNIELRPIVSVLDPVPLFSSEILDLSRWLSQTTCAPWVECIRCLIPTGILFRIREFAVKGEVKTGEKLSPPEEELLSELAPSLPAERAPR